MTLLDSKKKCPVFDDDKLLDYENKKYKASLNGHSTFTREYMITEAIKAGMVNKENDFTEMRYSFVEIWNKFPQILGLNFDRLEWIPCYPVMQMNFGLEIVVRMVGRIFQSNVQNKL